MVTKSLFSHRLSFVIKRSVLQGPCHMKLLKSGHSTSINRSGLKMLSKTGTCGVTTPHASLTLTFVAEIKLLIMSDTS